MAGVVYVSRHIRSRRIFLIERAVDDDPVENWHLLAADRQLQ